MENIMGLVLVLIAIISSISKSAAKSKAQNSRQQPYPQTQRPAAPKPAAPARPAAPRTEQMSMASMLPPRNPKPAAPLQPQVHPHLEPDCETHDIPGSLGVTSSEGKDLCHEEQLAGMRTDATAAPQEARPALRLDWTSDALVKAVVMQEVLTRPCQRQARR